MFRGKRGDLVKILWHDSQGMSLYRCVEARAPSMLRVARDGGRDGGEELDRVQDNRRLADNKSCAPAMDLRCLTS